MAAPASAAASAEEAISAAVTGKWGDIDGVWIDPVTAQEMMILRDAMNVFPYGGFIGGGADVDREVPVRRVAIAVLNQDVNLLKSGGRFSLKAATPSFDSGVS